MKTAEQAIPDNDIVLAGRDRSDVEELNTKARLCLTLCYAVAQMHLTQAQVAAALAIGQPKVSALLNYKLEGFSVARLMRFLAALGHDVEIVIKTSTRSQSGRIEVIAA
jgi:predicted XRE-type DNA-binding protein